MYDQHLPQIEHLALKIYYFEISIEIPLSSVDFRFSSWPVQWNCFDSFKKSIKALALVKFKWIKTNGQIEEFFQFFLYHMHFHRSHFWCLKQNRCLTMHSDFLYFLLKLVSSFFTHCLFGNPKICQNTLKTAKNSSKRVSTVLIGKIT